MITQKSTNYSSDKLRYASPVIVSMEIELEEGIAAVSPGGVDSSAQQHWKETETQSQDVQNNYW